jgi:hypothetical protein
VDKLKKTTAKKYYRKTFPLFLTLCMKATKMLALVLYALI